MSQPDPLAQLKDIHLPQEVSSYTVAPGWLILLAILFIIALGGFWLWRRKRKKFALASDIHQAFADLNGLDYSAHQVFRLLAIFKRVALMYLPTKAIAAKQGTEFLQWINSHLSADNQLTEDEIDWLANAAWRPSGRLSKEQWQQVVTRCEAACLELHRKLVEQHSQQEAA